MLPFEDGPAFAEIVQKGWAAIAIAMSSAAGRGRRAARRLRSRTSVSNVHRVRRRMGSMARQAWRGKRPPRCVEAAHAAPAAEERWRRATRRVRSVRRTSRCQAERGRRVDAAPPPKGMAAPRRGGEWQDRRPPRATSLRGVACPPLGRRGRLAARAGVPGPEAGGQGRGLRRALASRGRSPKAPTSNAWSMMSTARCRRWCSGLHADGFKDVIVSNESMGGSSSPTRSRTPSRRSLPARRTRLCAPSTWPTLVGWCAVGEHFAASRPPGGGLDGRARVNGGA